MSRLQRSVVPALAAVLLAAVLAVPAPASPPGERADQRFHLRLGAADLQPADGLRDLPPDRNVPFLVQFYEIPGQDSVERWRGRGIRLLRYAGGNAYVVHAPGRAAERLDASPAVRAILPVEPAMKRSRLFDRDPELAARLRRGDEVALYVGFQPGAGPSAAVRADRWELERLLERPDVAWVDPALPNAAPAADSVAERAGIHRVRGRPGFRRADGAGIRVGIWDWFPSFGHTDLEDRVVHAAVRPGEGLHGLWMSGIVAGAGRLDPGARGMVPAATLLWYSWRPDLWPRIAEARAEDDVRMTNHSWAIHPGWHYDWNTDWPHFMWTGDTWGWGYYHLWTAEADGLVRSSDVLLVMATGNDRELSQLGEHTHGRLPDASSTGILPQEARIHRDVHPPNPAYMSIAGPAIGKNVLTVGATNKDDVMSVYGGWGPTADGRLKPDLVAAGTDVLMPTENDGYVFNSGTSNSTAAVTGTAALLADYARRRYGAEPSALLLKGLLIHSARDLGRPGPDYAFGHGMADAHLAARVLRAGARAEPSLWSTWTERQLRHRDKHRLTFDVEPGAHELRATLVWHDPPGERLVNDLDLWLVSPGREVVRPFVLDPERPDAAARRGPNRADNVEVARVEDPQPGRWLAFVRATRVPMGPQRYALLLSSGDGNVQPPTHDEGSCAITRFYATSDPPTGPSLSQPKESFRRGDPLWLTTRFYVPENAEYGDFYGTIEVRWTITGPDGEVVARQAVSGTRRHTLAREWGSYFSNGFEVVPDLPPGDYVARTTVRMQNGEEATAAFPFRIER